MKRFTLSKGMKLLWQFSFLFLLILSITEVSAQNCSVNAGVDRTICSNEQLFLDGSYTKPIETGAEVIWTQIGGVAATIVSPTDLKSEVTNLIPGQSYTFRIYTTCEDGAFTYQDVTHTIEGISIADAGPDESFCPHELAQLSANAPGPEEKGIWTGGSDHILIDDPTDENSTLTLNENNTSTETLRWTIINEATDCSSFDEVEITNLGGDDNISAGADRNLDHCYSSYQSTRLSASYAGNGIEGQIGTWEQVSGPNVANIQSPNNRRSWLYGLVEGEYVFRWTVAGPCVSGFDELTITVPAPTADITSAYAGSDQIFCDVTTSSAVLSGRPTEYVNETVRWQLQSQSGGGLVTITNDSSSVTTVTGLESPYSYVFSYTISNDTINCSRSDNVRLYYFADAPTLNITTTDPIILPCGIDTAVFDFDAGGSGNTQYRIASGPGSGFPTPWGNATDRFAGNNSQILYGLDSIGTYEVELRRRTTEGAALACGTVYDNITIITSQSTELANAGTDQMLDCNVTSTDLVGNVPIAGEGTWSQIDGPIVIILTDPHQPTLGISGLTAEGEYTFRWVISGGPLCDPTQDDVVVRTAATAPNSVSPGTDQSICVGTPLFLDAENPEFAFEVGAWTATPSAGVVFSDMNDSKATAEGLLANTTYSFKWTVRNGCGYAADSITVDVTNENGPEMAVAGADQCLVSGTTETILSATNPTQGIGAWNVVSGPGTPNITSDTTIEDLEDGTYELEWVVSSGGCIPTRDTVVITIDNSIPAFTAGNDAMICGDSAILASSLGTEPSVGTGMWTQILGNAANIISPNSYSTSVKNLIEGTYKFRYTINNNACVEFSDVTLYVSAPGDVANIATDTIGVCASSSQILTADAILEGTGRWSILDGPNTPTIASVDEAVTNVTGLITGTYNFEWTVSGGPFCPSTSDTVTIEVVQAATAGADQSTCEDISSVELIGTIASSGTWLQVGSSPALAIVTKSGNNTAIASGLIAGTYSFEYQISAAGCSSADTMTVELITPPDTADAGPDQFLCDSDTFYLSANTPDEGIGNWEVKQKPSGEISDFSLATDPNAIFIPTPNVYGIYLFEWVISIDGCDNNADQVRIINNAEPSDAIAGANQTAVCGSSVTMDATAANVGLGTWTIDGAVPAGSIPNIVSVTNPKTIIDNLIPSSYPATYSFRWTVENGSPTCSPKTSTMTVEVLEPTIVADAGNDTILCNELLNFTLNGNDVSPDIGKWELVSHTASADPTFDPDLDTTIVSGLEIAEYNFKWTSTSSSGCYSEDFVTVVNNVQPTTDAGSDTSFCQFENVNLSAVPSNGTGTWSLVSKPGGAPDPLIIAENSPNTEVVGTIGGDYTFRWTEVNGICSDFDEVIISIDSIPVGVDTNLVVCSDELLNESINDFISTPAGGTDVLFTYTVVSSDPTNVPPGADSTNATSDPITDTYRNDTNSPVDITYAVTPSLGGSCVGNPFLVKITINPEPEISDKSVDVCSGNAMNYSLQNLLPSGDMRTGSEFTYTVVSSDESNVPAGADRNPGSGINITDNYSNLTDTTVNITYTIVPTSGQGCVGDTFDLVTTIFPEPVTNSSALLDTICSGDVTSISLTTDIKAPLVAQYRWATPVVTGSITGASSRGWSTNSNISQTLTNTGNSVDTVTYTVQTRIQGTSCQGATVIIKVAVQPEPVVNNQTITVCSDEVLRVDLNDGTNISVSTYNITSVNLNGLTISAGDTVTGTGLIANVVAEDAYTNTTNSPVNAVSTIVPVSADGCVGASFTHTVVVNPLGIVNPEPDTTFCNNEGATIVFTTPNSGGSTTYEWNNISSNGTGVSANGTTSGDLTFTALNPGVAQISDTIEVIPSFEGCAGVPDTFIVYVNPTAQVNDITSLDLCHSESSPDIIFSTDRTDGITTYTWSGTTAAINLNTSGTGDIMSFTAINTDTVPIIDTITVTPHYSNNSLTCEGLDKQFTITVNPTPYINGESKITLCSGETLNYEATSFVDGVSYSWIATNPGGGITGYSASGDTSVISEVLINTGVDERVVNYTFIPVGPDTINCPGPAFTLEVTVLNCQPVIGVAKQLVSTEYNADGTADVLFNIRVQNYGNVLLDSIQVTEDLDDHFGSGTYEVLGLSSTSFDVNTNFNGNSDTLLLSNSGTVNKLDVDASTDISLRLRILVPNSYTNQVIATSSTGDVSDESQEGSDPDDGSTINSENGDEDPTNNNVPTQVVIESCSVIANVTQNSTCGNAAGIVELSSGSSDGTITLNGTAQPALPSPATFSNLQAGHYVATFISSTGCIDTTHFEISNSNSTLAGAIVAHEDVKCFGGDDGWITIRATGGSLDYTYVLLDSMDNVSETQVNSNEVTFPDLDMGEYAVRITDGNGCNYTVSFDIEEPTQLVANLIGVTDGSCGATNDGSAAIDITGGTPPYIITIDSFPAASSGTEELISGIILKNMYEGTYKVIVTDDNSCIDSVYVPIGATACGGTVAVNDTLSATEDITLTGNLAVNDTVSISGGNIWTVVNTPGKGSVTINNNGTFEYIPEPDSFGVDSFSYMLCDVNAACDTAWVIITVASVDDQPDAVTDKLNVPEDATTSIHVLDNDNWGGDGPGTIAVTVNSTNGSVTVNDNGTPADPRDDFVDYTPNPDFNGFDSFVYEICDADDPADCDLATVSINVSGINDEPAAVNDSFLDAQEDTPYSADLSTNDTESADGGNIWTVLDDPARGTITIDNDGTFEYIPAADSFGLDSFSYVLCDLQGDCDTADVFITVASVNDQPDAIADNLTVPEDATTSILVLDNDKWGGDGPGTIAVTVNATNGSVTVNDNGTTADPSDDFVDYTPNPDFNGFDSFVYEICDAAIGGNPSDCDTAVVYINVGGINDEPIALLDSVETDEDTPLTGSLIANDTISGDGGNIWSVDTQADRGTVTVNVDGTFEYIPNADYNGLDSFFYKLCDIDNQCDTAKVIVTVNPVNDPPIVIADIDTTNEDTDVSFNIIDNDNDPIDGSIIDPGTIDLNPATVGIDTFFVVTGEGVYSVDSLTGILTFDPDTNFFGTTTPILYQVCDTGIPAPAECGTATITIEVLPVNDAPIAGVDVLLNQQNPGGINTIQIPAGKFSGTDVDGTISTIVITTLPDSVTSITVDNRIYTSIPVGGINIASTPDGQPIFDIEIDPLDTVSDIVLEYYVVDNEGLISEDPGTVTITFNELTIAGKVFNDINGLTDNLVNGAGTNLDDNLYVNLVNDLNQVLASVPVNTDGTYQFNEADGLSLDANFKIIITDGIQNINDILSEAILPDTLRSSGENIGVGVGNDGMPDGILNISTASENITQLSNLNFGIVHIMVMAEPDPTDANCDSNEDGSVQLSVLSDSIGAVTYELSTGETNTSGYFENLAAGGYIYTATDEDEYSVSGSFSIDDPNELELTIFEENDDTCYNSSTASATVMATGGTLPYQFDWMGTDWEGVSWNWTDPAPFQDSISIAENMPAGIYVVTVTDGQGCKEIETIEIEQPDSLNILLVDLINPDCDDAGEVKVMGTGGVAPYTFTTNYGTVNENVISDVYSGILTVTITDANGCTNSIDIQIEDIDVTSPLITSCSVNDTTGVDAGVCYADISLIPPVASDNCDSTSLIMSFRVIAPDNSISAVIDTAVTTTHRFAVGTSRVEWNIVDHTGNISECIQMVTVIEDEDPVITKCPANSIFANTIDVCGYVVPDDTLNAEATDNCELISLTHNFGEWGNSSSLEGATFPVGITEVLWIAEDASGNRDSCTTTIVVEDTQNPEFVNCPDGDTMTIALFSSVCEGSAIWSIPIASDNCDDVSVDQTAGPERGSPVAAGFYDIEYVATDLADNTDTCVFTIEVIDTDDPIAICPPDFHKDNDEGECSWTAPPSSISPLLATSNCPFEVLYDITGATNASGNDDASGTEFNLGVSVVTYTVNDTVNNQTWSCDFQVFVYDKEAPSIICEAPIDTTVTSGECYTQIDLVPPTAFDNCDTTNINMTFEVWAADNSRSAVIDTATTTTYNFAVGINQVIWTAIDHAGNEATCVQEVTVLEDEDPVITCPATSVFRFNVDRGMCGHEIRNTDLDATATDNCLLYTMSHNYGDWALQNTLEGAFFPVGSTDVTWTATDASGNTNACTITVTVIDNERPEFVNCPSNTTFTVGLFADACEGGSVWSIPVARDNCSDVSVTQIAGPALGTTLPVGLHNITYRARDRAGNTATCSFAINVVDTEDPVVVCQPNIVIDNDLGECSWLSPLNSLTPLLANSNCPSIVNWIVEDPDGTIHEGIDDVSGYEFELGTSTVSYSIVEIANGQDWDCSFTVTVEDTEAPVVDCQPTLEIMAAAGECSSVVDMIPPVSSDNCSDSLQAYFRVFGPDNSTGDLIKADTSTFEFNNGISRVEWTVVDEAGNETKCWQDVWVSPDIDALVPDAGENASICETDDSFETNAVAPDYANIVWTTSGTGSFTDSAKVNTSYIPSANDIDDGFVVLTITSSIDCASTSDQMLLRITYPPLVSAGEDASICETEDYQPHGILINSASSVLWSSLGSGTFNNTSVFNPVYTPSQADIEAGEVELVFRGISSSSCADELDTMKLFIDRLPIVNAGDDAWICEGDNFELSIASVQHGTEIVWTTSGTGTFLDNNQINTTYIPSESDILNGGVKLTITHIENGECQIVSDVLELNIAKQAEVLAGVDARICENEDYLLNGVTISGVSSVEWSSTGSGTFSNPNVNNPVYTPGLTDIEAGQVELIFNGISGSTCSNDLDTLNLIIDRMPVVNAGDEAWICEGESFILSGATLENSGIIEWSTNGTGTFDDISALQAVYNPSVSDVLNGTVVLTLSVTNEGECGVVSDELVLNISKTPNVDAGVNRSACFGQEVQINGAFADNYETLVWTTNGAGVIENAETLTPIYVPAEGESGVITMALSITSNPGCDGETLSDELSIEILPPLIVDVGDDQTIHSSSVAKLSVDVTNGSGSYFYNWEPEGSVIDPNSNYTKTKQLIGTTTFEVTVVDANTGCIASDDMVVNVKQTVEGVLNFYRGFSPNSDGVNDTWTIEGIENFPNNKVMIFNRWGDKVRHLENYDNNTVIWDGTNEKGEELPDGTYFYLVELENLDEFTGWVHIRTDR